MSAFFVPRKQFLTWCCISRDGREFAIKKFKPDKEGETVAQYSGISQSAVREMAVFPTISGMIVDAVAVS
jgi:hypothetical protein